MGVPRFTLGAHAVGCHAVRCHAVILHEQVQDYRVPVAYCKLLLLHATQQQLAAHPMPGTSVQGTIMAQK